MQFLAGNAIALLENGEQYFPALEARPRHQAPQALR